MGKANDCLQWAVDIALLPRVGEQTEGMRSIGEPPYELDDRDVLAKWMDYMIVEARNLTGVSPILVDLTKQTQTEQTNEPDCN